MIDLGGLEPSRAALQAGFAPAFDRFMDYNGDTVWDQSIQKMTVNCETFFIPAVRFALDATLGIAEHPDVQKQLEPEIEARLHQLGSMAKGLVGYARERMIFGHAYGFAAESDNPVLNAYHGVIYEDSILERLSTAPLRDVSVVAGGALHYWREQGFQGDAAERIAESEKLQLVSGLAKDRVKTVFGWLGTPYIDASFLMPDEVDTDHLKFTPVAFEAIMANMGRGCVGRMIEVDTDGPRLFDCYWRRIVNMFVHPEARVDNYEPSPWL